MGSRPPGPSGPSSTAVSPRRGRAGEGWGGWGGAGGGPGGVGTLEYRRVGEEEADREGMRMLRAARVDPEGMITFMEGLRRKEGDPAGFLRYLSTHPTTADRIERLRSLAGAPGRPSIKLLPDSDWTALRERC